MHDWS